MINKLNNAYKTIGEVARELDLTDKKNGKTTTHTIRFWEKNFKQLKPLILNNRRRYYDRKNIDLLKKIKFLLKEQGMTINGVKKILNTNQSNVLDESINKSIRAVSLKTKLKNISRIIKDLKK